MKIVGTSNYDDESVSDILVCENVNGIYVDLIVKLLNRNSGGHGMFYYTVKENDYKLYTFTP